MLVVEAIRIWRRPSIRRNSKEKTRHGLKKTGESLVPNLHGFLAAKVGSIPALPVEKPASHFLISPRINAKFLWILIKKESLTTTNIPIVSVHTMGLTENLLKVRVFHFCVLSMTL